MRRTVVSIIACFGCVFLWMNSVLAQRGGQEWLTSNADAQRSSWIRTDAKISKESLEKGGFKFLWKVKLDNEPRQLNSLTQPVLLDRLIGYKGFKSLAFVGGSSNAVYAIDYDLGRLYWKTQLKGSASSTQQTFLCPGGLTAAATRPTSLSPPAPGRGGGGNRVNSARSLVGDPDQGFPDVFGRGAAGGGVAAAPPRGAPGGPDGPGGPPRGGGGGFGGGGIGANSVFALGGDGMVHQLSVQTGKDIVMQPLSFVPANANATALILVDGVLYTSTANECGGAPNAVWAVDLSTPGQPIASWNTNGPSIAGSAGPTIGTDGTVYVATNDAAGPAANYANSVVALEPKTLKVGDYYTQPRADFSASPLVIEYEAKDVIIAAAKDRHIYVLNSTSLGGTDHHTPLSSVVTTGDSAPNALASWQDSAGTRWVMAPTGSAISAFKIVDQRGIPTLQPVWTSREMTSPSAPIVINDVVFALSSGEFRPPVSSPQVAVEQRVQRSKPAVLYALEASTGKELWNSGTTITSFAHSGGLSGGFGQVYVETYDSTFYTYGFAIEK
jgi:outer membrane protein assembly factor BamB